MYKSPAKKFLTLCVFALLQSNSAFADSEATAMVKNVGFQLIDLNSSDGIMPSITFSNSSTYTGLRMGTWGGTDDFVTDTSLRSQSTHPYSLSFSPSNSFAHTGASYNGQLFGNILSEGNFHSQGHYRTYLEISRNFTLSANTGVIFSGDLYTQAMSSITHDRSDWAGAEARFFVHGSFLPYGGQLFISNSTAYGNVNSQNQHFRYVIDNRDNTSNVGSISISAYVAGENYSAPVPVPEPESYAMMICGLAMLAKYATRRRKKSGFGKTADNAKK